MPLTTDAAFDANYPPAVRRHAFTHFTPLDVARTAAHFVAHRPSTRVLDVGSGAGKFCCVGALTTPGHFTGVERRPTLHAAARSLAKRLGIERVDFRLADVVTVDFAAYDAFFLFNPFFENLGLDEPIDEAFVLVKPQYERYCAFVRDQLSARPPGTRLCTYYSFSDDVPRDTYRQLPDTGVDKLLFWERRG